MAQRGTHVVGVAAAVVVIGVLVLAAVEGTRLVSGLGYEPSALASTTGTKITLYAMPDSYLCHGNTSGAPGGGAHPDWVTYCRSSSINVPAHSTITVTIKQYDSASTLHNPFFGRVIGTVGNVMYVNGKPIRSVPPSAPGHTFTIQTPPNANEDPLFVNVPLPGVADNAPNTQTLAGHPYPKPNVIVFRFRTGSPGFYIWHCYVPCGTGLAGDGLTGQDNFGGPMGATGYMAGTVTVT
jgi:hypothetical protein